jgi:CPA1 family monovalent cation:H+ antiporter
MHSSFAIYVILVLIIVLLVMLAQKLKVSYPIVLVIGGLAISLIPGIPLVEIDPELIFVIFLPPLLYEAAWETSWKQFWKFRRVIGSFAFLIVLLTSCVIAVVSNWLIPGFGLALGFLLGGIISPPDAVSASSILKTVKVPRALVVIVEGESLLNDAASLVVFRFAMLAVTTGQFVFTKAAASFFLVIIMGIVIGIAIALVFYALHRWLPTTPPINTVLTFVAPYLMYIVAEAFHFSGVLAVVSGGLFLSVRNQEFLDHRSRMQGWNVWHTIGFVLNGLVFMLIGLELPVVVDQLGDGGLPAAIKYSVIISAILIILRLMCTLGASLFTRFISHYITTADSNPGWKGPFIFGWTGMRGVVSLAAALSIPVYLADGVTPFPQRSMILFITFSVILITLVLQGLTLQMLIRMLHVNDHWTSMPVEDQDILVRRKMAVAALKHLNDHHYDKIHGNGWLKSIHLRLETEIALINNDPAAEGGISLPQNLVKDFHDVYLALLEEQRTLLLNLNKKDEVDEGVIRKYLSLLDIEQEKLEVQMEASE